MKNGSHHLTDKLSMRKMLQVFEMTYHFVEQYCIDKQWHNSHECANRKSVAWLEVMELGG